MNLGVSWWHKEEQWVLDRHREPQQSTRCLILGGTTTSFIWVCEWHSGFISGDEIGNVLRVLVEKLQKTTQNGPKFAGFRIGDIVRR